MEIFKVTGTIWFETTIEAEEGGDVEIKVFNEIKNSLGEKFLIVVDIDDIE